MQRLAQIAKLLLHEEPGDRRLEQAGDGLGAGVRPMGGAERVVHVEVAQRGEALGQAPVVLLLPGIEAGVLAPPPRRRAGAAGSAVTASLGGGVGAGT